MLAPALQTPTGRWPMLALVASDLTPRSAPPLMRARRLAADKTHLLHVIEADLPRALVSTLRPAARATLCAEAAAAGLLSEGLPEVAIGLPHLSIADAADRLGAGLILMGRHRQEVLGEVFVGTTLERVIRQAERPVLVCHDPQARPWREVIFATDLSPASLAAAQWFVRSGLAEGAHIVVAHAFIPLGQGLAGRSESGGPARETREEAQKLQAFAVAAGFAAADCLLLPGSPAPALAALVAARGPDLLVMGTRGPSGLRRGMIGSVAQALLRSGRLDMLAIPPAECGPPPDAGLPGPAASSNQEAGPTGAA
ncbi:MAG: universal stress protein [Gemmobacter sp.]|uniref:universal stress protein n=1 Tax=Gemmobacter sp. TaxID=1898957 RepID=UPI001A3D459C|nr:universal stress protein [Gemmobacter sp.]MBL8563537.1 universal stress protein [Gemmobacter sp.]